MKLKYRPEIDGLRTIAVLSVIIYHAEFLVNGNKALKGGFFGVDIFFVISGYLITSLIMTEYKKTGSFSFIEFYERRARRLLPALLTVILCSLPFAWNILLPSQFVDYAKSLIASVLFWSNFYWLFSLQEYGAESALLKPFLHTWSLAVEEQFYLFFPLIFIGIYKTTKRIGVFFALIIVISLIHAEVVSEFSQSNGFYMLASRFWELVSGSLLAWYVLEKPRQFRNKMYQWMPVLGLLCIGFSVGFIEYSSGHPGLITLIPVIGTLLLILFCREGSIIRRILSSKLFVGVGLISYSLYLWHYPIFAFGRLFNPSFNDVDKLVWIGVTFILSILSYQFIEVPFRDKKILKTRFAMLSMALSVIIILLFSFYVIHEQGAERRFVERQQSYGINEFDNKILGRKTWGILKELAKRNGYEKYHLYAKEGLSFSRNTDRQKVLIVGNSHGRDMFNALYQNRTLFDDLEFAYYLIQIGAPTSEMNSLFASPNFKAADIILISSRYNDNKSRPGYKKDFKALPEFIDRLKKEGKGIVITSRAVEYKNIQKKPVFDWYKQSRSDKEFSINELERIYFEERKLVSFENNMKILSKIAKNKKIKLLDKQAFMCQQKESRCDAVTQEGYKLFYDPFGHFTLEGAAYFGKRINELAWLELN